jgi:HD-like signal output (HDOD) protein
MMLDIPPEQVQEDPKGSASRLENYLQIISDSPMFPAFAANIQELLVILEDPYYPVFEVSRVVLRDVSLTTQILKLVNSCYFQSRQRQVHTISSAVMIMGFELVRDLAVGLRLFENFQKSPSLDKVKQLMFLSFFMALAVQELAQQDHRFAGEELFLTALLYNFGELAAAYYFPEEYRRVLDVVQAGSLNKADAVRQVFHCSLDDLGQALLMTWNFPDSLRARLADLKKPGWELPGPTEQRRRLFRSIDELSQAFLSPEIHPEKRQKLQEKMARQLGLQSEVVVRSMTVCLHRLEELTRILNLDMANLGLRLPLGTTEEERAPATIGPEEAAAVDADQTGIPDDRGPDQELTRLNFLLQVMEEINQGIGFDRVVFCMVDPQRTWITGRFGMGEGMAELLPLLKTPFASKTNPLSLAVAQAREYLVTPRARPEEPPFLDEEFWQASGAQAVLVSPILIDAAPIGVIYLDRLRALPAITALDRQRLQSFRDLAVIALRLSSQRGQEGFTK